MYFATWRTNKNEKKTLEQNTVFKSLVYKSIISIYKLNTGIRKISHRMNEMFYEKLLQCIVIRLHTIILSDFF